MFSSLIQSDKQVSKSIRHLLAMMGLSLLTFFDYLGGLVLLAKKTIVTIFTKPIQYRLIVDQFYFIGVKSLALTNLVAIFTGMVLALQFIVSLDRFGLKLYAGQVVGISIVRELGPVLTSLMVAARVGAGIAAEIGSMTVTEQVLAIEAMGANPIAKLVVPRVIVTTLVTPILTVMADVIGILGGMVVTVIEAGVSPQFYMDQVLRTVQLEDFISGTGKTLFFGFFIGLVACYQGLKTERGTQGVGDATTHSVVIGSVIVFVSDYFLTKLFLMF